MAESASPHPPKAYLHPITDGSATHATDVVAQGVLELRSVMPIHKTASVTMFVRGSTMLPVAPGMLLKSPSLFVLIQFK